MLNLPTVRERGEAAKEKVRLRLTQPKSWILPKQTSSIAPAHVWTNAGL
jgi:nucleobase:cation symporter-1, NCS1 family